MAWTDVRLVVGIVVLASMGTECIGEFPASKPVEAAYATTLTLTADKPVAVRTLHFIATSTDERVNEVSGYLEVVGEGGGGPGGQSHSDVWLSVINADTGVTPEGAEGIGHASVDGWGHSAPCDGASQYVDGKDRGLQSTPCEGSWTVIARWLDPSPDSDVKLELNARMTGSISSSVRSTAAPTFDQFSITDADQPVVDGQPAVTRGVVRGSATVGSLGQPEEHDLKLHVPAALIAQAAKYPRLGRMFVGSTVTAWTGPPAHADVVATVAGRQVGGYGGGGGEMEWLSLCDPGKDCDLPIHLTIQPRVMDSHYNATPAPDGSMSIDWIVDVRLEDFGANAAFPAAIELIELR